MNNNSKTQILINDNEIADFVVCEESWRLKKEESHHTFEISDRAQKAIQEKSKWKNNVTDVSFIKDQLKVPLCLLVGVVIIAITWELSNNLKLTENPKLSKANIPLSDGILLLLLIAALVVWNSLKNLLEQKISKTGVHIAKNLENTSLSTTVKQESFTSDTYKIHCKPDAIIAKGNTKYPVLKLPVTKKIHDRHVAKITTQLLCIEDIYGERPSYGIMILGEKSRRVELKYTDKKKKWILGIIEKINRINQGLETSTPTPNHYKCKNCDVSKKCKFNAIKDT